MQRYFLCTEDCGSEKQEKHADCKMSPESLSMFWSEILCEINVNSKVTQIMQGNRQDLFLTLSVQTSVPQVGLTPQHDHELTYKQTMKQNTTSCQSAAFSTHVLYYCNTGYQITAATGIPVDTNSRTKRKA